MTTDDIWVAVAIAGATASGCFMLITRRNVRQVTKGSQSETSVAPKPARTQGNTNDRTAATGDTQEGTAMTITTEVAS